MKQLTDTELKEFAVSLLDKQGLEQYEQFIADHDKRLKQDCEYNGFYNTPAECEDWECDVCVLSDSTKRGIDCPYIS